MISAIGSDVATWHPADAHASGPVQSKWKYLLERPAQSNENPEASAKILEVVPLKRFGEAADIANMTAYLWSEEASYITGQVFNVDGGMAM